MRDRLAQLGWDDIDVVDEDLGRSAAGLVTRSGFDAWSPMCVWGRAAPSRHARSRALRTTAVNGSTSSRCAGSSIPC